MQPNWMGKLLTTPLALSVSSVGSSGMQPCRDKLPIAPKSAFSILGRIERDATEPCPDNRRVGANSFSILGRIERDATLATLPTAPPRRRRFQYPRSDRAGCNFVTAIRWDGPLLVLSVSSVGSSGMQHVYPHPDSDPHSHFQYPRSDRAGCNAFPPGGQIVAVLHFQYPRSDRAGCNDLHVDRGVAAQIVFQYPRSDRAGCNVLR